MTVGAVAGLVAAGGVVWFLSREATGAPEPAPVVEIPPTPGNSRPCSNHLRPLRNPNLRQLRQLLQFRQPRRLPPRVSIVTATVCLDFSTAGSEWACTPVTRSASAGRFVFYTRIKATQPTTIEHRWYRGASLHQRVSLPVAANTGAGYRTFSRNTVGADRAGTWRVELRDVEDVVLSRTDVHRSIEQARVRNAERGTRNGERGA